jgi:hypothetical protein
MKRWPDLVGGAKRLESVLAARVEGAARRVTRTTSRAPLEIVYAIVDAIEQEAQPAGRGRRVFPFTVVRVSLAAATPRVKAHLQAALDGPPDLAARILGRLHAAGCASPAPTVTLAFVPRARQDWPQPEFHLEFATPPAAPVEPAAAASVRLELDVMHGAAAQPSYTFTAFPIAIGRGAEVHNAHRQLIRRNDVAFRDGGDAITSTVSRRHARIERDAATGALRLYDEGSAQGTNVVRQGRVFVVPCGARGLRLEPGDEIALGQARLSVKALSPSLG